MTLGMISIDVDSLHDLFPGYTGADPVYQKGLPRLEALLAGLGIPITLFVVGQDVRNKPANQKVLRRFAAAGHELANHSMTHPQGFGRLAVKQKEAEIDEAAAVIADLAGRSPVGFRAPGWNIDEETLDLLQARGYAYDSSVFPSWTSLLFKPAHYRLMARRPPQERTTMGRLSFQWAPSQPYHAGQPLWRRGSRKLLEIPIMTVPWLRLPFFGTFSFWIGCRAHQLCYRLIRRSGRVLNYELHGVEFVDAQTDGVPGRSEVWQGAYIPKPLTMPWKEKALFLGQTLKQFRENYTLVTMEQAARLLSEAAEGGDNSCIDAQQISPAELAAR